MATTPEGARLTRAYRAAQLAIRARSLRGLIPLWRTVNPTNLRGTIGTFTEAATLLAGQGFDESASGAQRYFRQFRRAEAGSDEAIVADVARPTADDVAAELRGAALAGIIDARRAGKTLPAASDSGLVRVSGALAKLVLAGGWMTIISAATSDPEVTGWARVTSGDPCAFCRMLASRGQVYKTEKAADFQPHGDCACTPEPIYAGPVRSDSPLHQAETYLAEYRTAQEWARESGTMSQGTSNDSLNNYRRWLANGSPDPGEKVTGAPGE